MDKQVRKGKNYIAVLEVTQRSLITYALLVTDLVLHSVNALTVGNDHLETTILTTNLLVAVEPTIGNLRTTTKFTTTTSVDWERTGTRTSVSAGKRKLKMKSIGRSTTTTLNVNKHVGVVQL